MWKTFTVCHATYMLKIVEANEEFQVYVSDLKDIWYSKNTREKLVEIFQECNPNIKVETDEVIPEVLKVFEQINEAEVTVANSDDKINLDIKSGIPELDTKFKIKYNLDLKIADKNEFIKEITAPMMHTINYLEEQQKMLITLVQKKDRELEEYKMEKGLISREDLISEKFDSALIEKSAESLMLGVFEESSNFWKTFTEKHGNVEKKIIQVNVEPWNNVKRKRKVYNSKTSIKKPSRGIVKKE